MTRLFDLTPAFLLVAAAGVAHAGEARPAGERAGIEFFEARIRPVLVEHCYKCHSVSAGKSKGDLRLDSREASRTKR